jgi:hypothetical protein
MDNPANPWSLPALPFGISRRVFFLRRAEGAAGVFSFGPDAAPFAFGLLALRPFTIKPLWQQGENE